LWGYAERWDWLSLRFYIELRWLSAALFCLSRTFYHLKVLMAVPALCFSNFKINIKRRQQLQHGLDHWQQL
jgi:hypothetical protein